MFQTIYEWLMIVGGILFIILFFAYGPYQRHRLKLKHSKPPDELVEIMNGLPEVWRLNSYSWHSAGWYAELEVSGRRFTLCEDYGRIFPDEILEYSNRVLDSAYDRQWIAGGPATIRQQLLDAVPTKKD